MKHEFFKNIISVKRFKALIIKEISQLFRNKTFIFLLIFPPTIQLCLYGFVLSPNVEHIKLGIADHSKTLLSRELISALTENKVFIAKNYTENQKELSKLVQRGKLTAGIIIPPDFTRNLHRDKPANIQIFVDGVDAYTSGVASGYIRQILYEYNLKLLPEKIIPKVKTQIIFLYNPGLVNSWFFVLGVMGMIITFTSSLSSASESIREKETGTLEQLLITPASSLEILLAKMLPLFIIFSGVAIMCLTIAKIIFNIPLNGNLLLFMILTGIYVIISISLGLLIGTFSQNNQQVILTGIFINLPLVILSGAITPIESMPQFFQYLTLLNPLRHYVIIIRGILMKGVGLETLWTETAALMIFAVLLLSISSYRFRSQL